MKTKLNKFTKYTPASFILMTIKKYRRDIQEEQEKNEREKEMLRLNTERRLSTFSSKH